MNSKPSVGGEKCGFCHGTGMIADYVGMAMRPVGITCDHCGGSGAEPTPSEEPAKPMCWHCGQPIRETHDRSRNEWDHMDGFSYCNGNKATTWAWPIEPPKSGADEAKAKGLDCPDSQGWWWHWQGREPYPFVYSILRSNSFPDGRYFVQYPDSRWCDEMKGTWLKVPVPEFPDPSISQPPLEPITIPGIDPISGVTFHRMPKELIEALDNAPLEPAPKAVADSESGQRCVHGVWVADHCYQCGPSFQNSAIPETESADVSKVESGQKPQTFEEWWELWTPENGLYQPGHKRHKDTARAAWTAALSSLPKVEEPAQPSGETGDCPGCLSMIEQLNAAKVPITRPREGKNHSEFLTTRKRIALLIDAWTAASQHRQSDEYLGAERLRSRMLGIADGLKMAESSREKVEELVTDDDIGFYAHFDSFFGRVCLELQQYRQQAKERGC